MPFEKIGYRRLYDALGCSLVGKEEVRLSKLMGEIEVEIYFGPRPMLGIAVINQNSRYVMPKGIQNILKVEYNKDATKLSYSGKFFTEIICIKQVKVSQELSDSFHSKDSNAQNELLRLSEENADDFKTAVDLIAGIIGLRFHQQFVLEMINENFFTVRNENDWPLKSASNDIRILESISLNSFRIKSLEKNIKEISNKEKRAQKFAAIALGWLLRAWPESNNIYKFLSLFIPMEIILSGYKGDPENEENKRDKINKIRDIIVAQNGQEYKKLLKFFNQIVGNLRPSLVSRFEQLAKEAKIKGWENDIVAFQRFNSMRNKLLHHGDWKVKLAMLVGEKEIHEETRNLQDLVERYVNWVLFGDDIVYPSKWRT